MEVHLYKALSDDIGVKANILKKNLHFKSAGEKRV